MSKKLIVGIIVLIVLVAGGMAGYFLFQQQQDLRGQAAPATSMAMSASPPVVDVGGSTSISITIDTAENVVKIVELFITFDPTLLQSVEVTPGGFIPNPSTIGGSPNNTAGTISYSLYTQPGDPGVQGIGTVANITFDAIEAGTADIEFGSNTQVVAVDEETNVLISSQGTSVTTTGAVVETHLTCVNEACVEVTGTGLDSCTVATQAEDCAEDIVETHLICQNEACVEVSGVGIDECTVANQATTCAEDNEDTQPSPSPSASPAASAGTGGGGTGTGSGTGTGIGGTTSPSPTPAANLPESGVTGPTLMVAGFGMLFILLGLAALAL